VLWVEVIRIWISRNDAISIHHLNRRSSPD
jgi:hypothetical protein